MNKQELTTVLKQLGDAEPDWRSNKQVSISCPLATWTHQDGVDGDPSLSIKYGVTPTVFKCFGCGAKGSLASLVASYARHSGSDELRALAEHLRDHDKPTLRSRLQAAMEEPDEIEREIVLDDAVLTNFPTWRQSSGCVDHLATRGVSEGVADLFDLHYDPNQDRLLFPARNASSELVGIVGRTLCDDSRKYRNYLGFKATLNVGGIHLCNPLHDTVVVTEGFMDGAHVYEWACEMRVDIVWTWTSTMHAPQADVIMGLDKKVLMCYDNDSAGEKGTPDAIKQLHKRCPTKRGLFTSQDVGSTDRDQFVQTITDAHKRQGDTR